MWADDGFRVNDRGLILTLCGHDGASSIAYQVLRNAPIDQIVVPGLVWRRGLSI
jgi:hypothetical protein